MHYTSVLDRLQHEKYGGRCGVSSSAYFVRDQPLSIVKHNPNRVDLWVMSATNTQTLLYLEGYRLNPFVGLRVDVLHPLHFSAEWDLGLVGEEFWAVRSADGISLITVWEAIVLPD